MKAFTKFYKAYPKLEPEKVAEAGSLRALRMVLDLHTRWLINGIEKPHSNNNLSSDNYLAAGKAWALGIADNADFMYLGMDITQVLPGTRVSIQARLAGIN